MQRNVLEIALKFTVGKSHLPPRMASSTVLLTASVGYTLVSGQTFRRTGNPCVPLAN